MADENNTDKTTGCEGQVMTRHVVETNDNSGANKLMATEDWEELNRLMHEEVSHRLYELNSRRTSDS